MKKEMHIICSLLAVLYYIMVKGSNYPSSSSRHVGTGEAYSIFDNYCAPQQRSPAVLPVAA